ncbi:hypothetical protein OJJOAM_002314 [Cupriavidus sp. H18C1]
MQTLIRTCGVALVAAASLVAGCATQSNSASIYTPGQAQR